MPSVAGAPTEPPTYDDNMSQELDEAVANLLHSSLDIHDERERMQWTNQSTGLTNSRERQRRVSRVKSTEGLRLPPPLVHETRPIGGTSQHPGEGASGNDAGRQSSSLNGSNGPLLRRVTSVEQMLDAGTDDDLEDDGFTSEDEPFRIKPPSIASSATSQRSSFLGIRLEDHSENHVAAFASEAKITGYHSVGAQNAGGFVVFDIDIRTREGSQLRIHRRYSAFVRLRKELLQAQPQLKACVPPLPPKSSFAKFRASFLEKRRQHLSFWLSTVLLHPIAGSSPIVRHWVLE
ncbi:hypothetical protein ACM66B_002055 [Microbotryomycetes sp. NB124-2]